MYGLAIGLPFIVFYIEYKGTNLGELINVWIAKLFIRLGNNKIAKDILIKLTSKNKDSYIAHKLLAEIYEKEGGMRKSIDEYDAVVEASKKSVYDEVVEIYQDAYDRYIKAVEE